MASRFAVGITGTKTWTNADTSIWSATSGGASGASVPGSGDTVTLDANSGTGILQPNYDFTVTSITMGAFGGTLDFSINNNNPTLNSLNCSGTGIRTFNMGNGTWNVVGNSTTIWTTSTSTNLTFNANNSTLQFSYSGSVGTRSITYSTSHTYNIVLITAGSDIVATGTSALTCTGNYSEAGFTGTHTNSGGMTVGGNFTLGLGSTFSSTAGTLMLTSSTSAAINTNGVNMNKNLNINGSGIFTLQNNIDMSGALAVTMTLTQGTFNANNFNVSISMFNTSNSNVRSLIMGSGTWTISGSGTTIWNFTTTTNLTFNPGNSTLLFSYPGATGTRIINPGNLSYYNITINNASDIISINSGFTTNNMLSVAGVNIASSLVGTARVISFKSASFSSIASWTDISFIMTNSGGSWILNENLTMTGTSLYSITITGGNFDTGGFNVSTKSFNSSNSNIRSVMLRASTVTLTGSGTVWNVSTTSNLTFSAGTSTIKMNDASSASKTFSGDSLTYWNILISGSGTGMFILGTSAVSMTLNNLSVDTPPHTVQFFAGGTTAISTLTLSGTTGNVNIFQSTVNGSLWFITASSGVLSEDFISLQDSWASGGAVFVAGANSVDVSDNTGWIFGTVPISAQQAKKDQNFVNTMLVEQNNSTNDTILIYANPVSHGILIDDGTGGMDFGSQNAKRDQNFVTVSMAASSSNGTTPISLYGNAGTHGLLVNSS